MGLVNQADCRVAYQYALMRESLSNCDCCLFGRRRLQAFPNFLFLKTRGIPPPKRRLKMVLADPCRYTGFPQALQG